MSPKNVLITGGAGFIGAHVCNELLEHGYKVRILDALVPQVHGPFRSKPDYLSPDVELMVGDIRDSQLLSKALRGIDGVINLVALVGVGQSMYQIEEYTSVNNCGTATLMQVLSTQPVESIVVASSMSIYGEGLYEDVNGVRRTVAGRSLEQLKAGRWEMTDSDGGPLSPVPTPEDKVPSLASLYALSKFDQEQMTLMVARAYGMRAVALRFFNTYGPYQALSNPYTGVLSNFAARVLNGHAPLIYEDGLQKRDFVSVYDVACACRLALESMKADGQAFNISSGEAMTVGEVALKVIRALGVKTLEPEITGKYRVGDIRHCFADISRAKEILGWSPSVGLKQGVEDLAAWLEGQKTPDRAVQARDELAVRGLMI
ncbi:MAG TPA: NAD-dependent epimerase/dehydratase family protein [Bryobacteraceae bacterium]|nr:NAD-dependent epimerase/dehydratase family protein [Bryobacteraceae bacterium]